MGSVAPTDPRTKKVGLDQSIMARANQSKEVDSQSMVSAGATQRTRISVALRFSKKPHDPLGMMDLVRFLAEEKDWEGMGFLRVSGFWLLGAGGCGLLSEGASQMSGVKHRLHVFWFVRPFSLVRTSLPTRSWRRSVR